MPMYEYQCSKCEVVVEEMQKFSDAPLTNCEKCGAKGTLSKLISKSSFALKGTGWYTTDYKKSSAPKAASEAAAPTTGATPASAAPSTAANAPAAPASSVASPSPSKSNKAD